MTSGSNTLSPARSCRECGRTLVARELGGVCAACLWEWFAGEAGFPAGTLRIPGHEILEEIARGGMGIVYRARQLDPPRTVALKMLLPHQLGVKDMAERFRLEARALAELDHTAILPVHHFGEQDGMPWFTMKLAPGGTLAQRKAEFAGDWRRIAELIATLADAVQFAHERGVLHRDLKPGNVLFDEAGRAYLSDFGLAKLVNSDSDLTRSTDFLGTPHYVAPEIAAASARAATTASDIYALGASLYELLAGRPPFEAESVPALLRKIVEDEPKRFTFYDLRFTPGRGEADVKRKTKNVTAVPRDLEIICLKCLAREPARRYATARDLADDLRRWLDGHAIRARPSSAGERLWLWTRRRPALAGLGVALGLALLAGLGGVLWQWRRAEQHALASERRLYLADMNLVAQALQVNNLDRARALLERHRPRAGAPDLRGWEWHFFIAESRDLSSHVFRSGTRSRSLDRVALSPDGRTLALPSAHTNLVELWDTATRRRRESLPFDATWVRYSGGERYLFGFAPNWSGLWDLQAGREIPFNPLDGIFNDAIFAGDETFFAISTRSAADGATTVRLRRTTNGAVFAERRFARAQLERSNRLALLPGGTRLAVSGGDGNLYVLRLPGLEEDRVLSVSNERLTGLAASPDGRWLAAGAGYGDTFVRLWDMQDDFRMKTLRGHAAWVESVAFSKDSRLLASASTDQTARVWDLKTLAPLHVLRGHQAAVSLVEFAGHDELVTGDRSGEVKWWNLAGARTAGNRLSLAPMNMVSLSADHRSFAALDAAGRVVVGATDAPDQGIAMSALGTNTGHPVISADAAYVATAGTNSVLRLWRRVDGTIREAPHGHQSAPKHVHFGGAGWFLVTVGEDRWVKLWSADLQLLRSWQFPEHCRLWFQNVVPELDLFIADEPGGPREVRRLTDGALVTHLPPAGTLTGLAPSPDRRTLLLSDGHGTVEVRDTTTWQLRARLRGHLTAVGSVAFSPDGRRIATGGMAAEGIKLWDAETFQEICALPVFSDYTAFLSFSSEGRSLAFNPARGAGLGQILRVAHPK